MLMTKKREKNALKMTRKCHKKCLEEKKII